MVVPVVEMAGTPESGTLAGTIAPAGVDPEPIPRFALELTLAVPEDEGSGGKGAAHP